MGLFISFTHTISLANLATSHPFQQSTDAIWRRPVLGSHADLGLFLVRLSVFSSLSWGVILGENGETMSMSRTSMDTIREPEDE